jgi:two-component system C4-dicarboxylate transport response regulator DctD
MNQRDQTRWKKVVLVLDDDEDFRTALAETLRDDGYEVLDYATPVEVPLSDLGNIAALVTDYRMPLADGVSFADKFHALHADAPVVLVTSYSTAFLEAEVAARPYVRLMRKPFDYTTLQALLPQ